MGTTTLTRSSTPTASAPPIELAWQVERLEAGDFAALSSDGTTWYAGNIFTGQCDCAASKFGKGEPCKHAWAARMAYWQVLDEARRTQAATVARSQQKHWHYDYDGAPGYAHVLEPYYAPLPQVA